ALQPYTSDLGGRDDGVGAKVVVREDVVGADRAQGKVAVQIQIDSAAGHEPKSIVVLEQIGRQAMATYETFEKWREIVMAPCEFGPRREVVESGVVNSLGHAGFTAAPMTADVASQSEPTAEVVGNA